MTNVAGCVATKARFIKSKYEVDQNVTVEVFIKYVAFQYLWPKLYNRPILLFEYIQHTTIHCFVGLLVPFR